MNTTALLHADSTHQSSPARLQGERIYRFNGHTFSPGDMVFSIDSLHTPPTASAPSPTLGCGGESMGRKRKSGGAEAEDTVPAKRATVVAAAQLRQRSAPATASSKGGAATTAKATSGSDSGQGEGAGKKSVGRGGPKVKGSSIDDMFGQLKAKRRAAEPALAAVVEVDTDPAGDRAPRAKQPRMKGSKEDIFGEGIQPGRRYDEEGLPIFSPDELGIGKGGDSADCPFDCECCL